MKNTKMEMLKNIKGVYEALYFANNETTLDQIKEAAELNLSHRQIETILESNKNIFISEMTIKHDLMNISRYVTIVK